MVGKSIRRDSLIFCEATLDANAPSPYPCHIQGGGCVPVDASVFKTGGGLRRVGRGGFDSHPLPFSPPLSHAVPPSPTSTFSSWF